MLSQRLTIFLNAPILRAHIKNIVMAISLSLSIATTAYAQSEASTQSEEVYVVEDYWPFVFLSDDPSRLCLCGDIDDLSSLNFKKFILDYGPPELLFFDSPGGDVQAALNIALDVHFLEIYTALPAEGICYSACAFIFLGGKEKFLEGELGVHQIDSYNNDIKNTSSTQFAIAAIVDVLNRFDTPKFVYTRMLSTPPDEIYVFTSTEAWEIAPKEWWEIIGVDEAENPDATQISVERQLNKQEIEAVEFVKMANAAWSEESKYYSIDIVTNLYAETSKYYGDMVSRSIIYDDKTKFALRWPNRNYHADDDNIYVNCNDENYCSVTAIVNWDVQNPGEGRSATGESQWEYILQFKDGRFYIIEESAYVISRG